MADHLLSMQEKMQTLQEDLESLFLVLLYSIIRYVGYDVEIEDQQQVINIIFFQSKTRHGQSHGGDGNVSFLKQSYLS